MQKRLVPQCSFRTLTGDAEWPTPAWDSRGTRQMARRQLQQREGLCAPSQPTLALKGHGRAPEVPPTHRGRQSR